VSYFHRLGGADFQRKALTMTTTQHEKKPGQSGFFYAHAF
jgi:hypothetical protein